MIDKKQEFWTTLKKEMDKPLWRYISFVDINSSSLINVLEFWYNFELFDLGEYFSIKNKII